jgi:hypothetical protein
MSNIIFQTLSGAEKIRSQSNTLTPDFVGVNIGADALAIAQGGTGASAYFDFGSRAIRSSFTAQDGNDLVNKSYADALAAGLLVKDSVRAATATGETLNLSSMPATVDGVTLASGNRFLAKNQATASQNGIYQFNGVGAAATRTADFDGTPSSEVRGGVFTFVQEGTVNEDSGWVLLTNGTITVGTTALSFGQFSGAGQIIAGAALSKSGNTLNVKYDNVTIGLNLSNELEVKDAGITLAKLASDSVDESKLTVSVAGDGLGGGGGAALSVNTGDAVKIDSDAVAVDFALTKTNDNASAITIRKVVYVNAAGNVDLAEKDTANLFESELGVVEDASIDPDEEGKVIFRRGAVIGGFTGLTPGKEYYVDTAGDIALYSAITYAPGEFVMSVGKALSATEIAFNPAYQFTY